MITSAENGLYQNAETILHKLDPRVKVLSCLVLVVLSFAAVTWWQLLFVLSIVAIAVWAVSSLPLPLPRLLWMLRWLLLFTLLLHVLFSPGRTLWGARWLSLDGLVSGTFVCMQMLLAVTVSILLAVTTSTENLSRTFGWFVEPLRWFGCRTREWQKVVLLAMDFVPVIHAEIRLSHDDENECSDSSAHINDEGRFSVWGKKWRGFIHRMVNRGDEIAQRLAVNEDPSSGQSVLPALFPMALLDKLFSLAVCLMILSYWLVG